MRVSLATDHQALSCYFRSSVDGTNRKALLQITERCNLHCAHCFVSSTKQGHDMDLRQIVELVLPRLASARVERVTLTGGEPFVHPEIIAIAKKIVESGFKLGICTNATLITDDYVSDLEEIGNVHVNVSFDGFSAQTHGKFRGDTRSFEATKRNTEKLAKAGLLQGILSTPNTLTSPREFVSLCDFAEANGAEYILMNPLSSFGRGVASQRRLGAAASEMRLIRELTTPFSERGLDVVHVRFPNDDLPLSGCEAGKIIYVFTNGDVSVCPYLTFAARTQPSVVQPSTFIVGNILRSSVREALESWRLKEYPPVGDAPICADCALNSACGKGCPAAVIARGGSYGDVDEDQCPGCA